MKDELNLEQLDNVQVAGELTDAHLEGVVGGKGGVYVGPGRGGYGGYGYRGYGYRGGYGGYRSYGYRGGYGGYGRRWW